MFTYVKFKFKKVGNKFFNSITHEHLTSTNRVKFDNTKRNINCNLQNSGEKREYDPTLIYIREMQKNGLAERKYMSISMRFL